MTHNSFPGMINERLAAIELVAARTVQQGDESDLRDLRVLLINVMGLLIRNPGIEAAADDLYAAAAAVVMDNQADLQPARRRKRLLRDATLRFCERVRGVAEEGASEDRLILRGISALYAAQVAHRTAASMAEVQ